MILKLPSCYNKFACQVHGVCCWSAIRGTHTYMYVEVYLSIIYVGTYIRLLTWM